MTFHERTAFLIMCFSCVTALSGPLFEWTDQQKEQPTTWKELRMISAGLLTQLRTRSPRAL